MKLNSGDIAPASAEYKIVCDNGKIAGTVHVAKGDKMPPTQSSTQHFER